MPFIKRNYRIFVFVALLFFLKPPASFAADVDDGFGSSRRIEGKHFTIYYAPQIEVFDLIKKLNINPSDELAVGKTFQRGYITDETLADMLDTLFMQVCNILDMQLYSFKGEIKICRDLEHLNSIYKGLFNKETNTRSFYSHALNTIYTCEENFTREIIGHEIAHAVISHYFVVLPSVRIQEVLAMYVEYQLRKLGQ